jgi:tetratricopeptide (TPR) repeat protein
MPNHTSGRKVTALKSFQNCSKFLSLIKFLLVSSFLIHAPLAVSAAHKIAALPQANYLYHDILDDGETAFVLVSERDRSNAFLTDDANQKFYQSKLYLIKISLSGKATRTLLGEIRPLGDIPSSSGFLSLQEGKIIAFHNSKENSASAGMTGFLYTVDARSMILANRTVVFEEQDLGYFPTIDSGSTVTHGSSDGSRRYINAQAGDGIGRNEMIALWDSARSKHSHGRFDAAAIRSINDRGDRRLTSVVPSNEARQKRERFVKKNLELAKTAEANLQCDDARKFDRLAQANDNQQHSENDRDNGSVIDYRACSVKMRFSKATTGNNPEASYAIAGGFDADGDHVRAKTIYRTIAERFAGRPIAVKAADRLTRIADVERIEASNREAASRIERTNAEAAQQAARIRQENEAIAQKALQAKQAEERQQALYLTGEVHETNGNRPAAKAVYRQIVDSFPRSPVAVRAADRLTRLAEIDAIESSNRETAKRMDLAKEEAAKQELRARQESEAVAKRMAAEKQEANQLQALYLQGEVYESSGNRDRAKAIYRQVIERYPHSALALKAADRLRHITERERIELAKRESQQQRN